MRHFLWHKASGVIGGEATRSGGFHGYDPYDPESPEEVTSLVACAQAQFPEFVAWVVYDCPCDPGLLWCSCAVSRVADSKVVEGSLVLKPDTIMVVDGADQDSNTAGNPISKTAASTVTFKLRESQEGSIPDGTEISLNRSTGVYLSGTWPITLTFSGGETNQVNLTAPGVGSVGGLGFFHELYSHGGGLYILGQ